MRPAFAGNDGRRTTMIEVELRLLGTQVLGLTLGRGTGEDNDEWWCGYRDGRSDRAAAYEGEEYDEGHEVDPTDYIWANGQPIALNYAKFAAVDEDDQEVGWDDLQEEWAELEETEE
jgi:hypothetical protein